MDAATPHAVIAPAAEGHTDFSASRDELLEAKLAAIESLLKRRTAVAIWLSGLSLDSLEALLPRNKAALKLLEVFAEGAYDNEQRKWHEEELRRQDDERRRQEAREQRLNVILRAIEDATDLSEALRKDLTKLFIHGVNELVIGVDFRPPYLEDAVKARSLLPTSFGDEIKAIYAKYDIFSSSTMHPLDSARPLIKVKSSRWDLADLTKNNIVWSPNLDITADLPNTMDKFMISVVDAKRTLVLKTDDMWSRQTLAELHNLVGEDFFNRHYNVSFRDVATSQDESVFATCRKELNLLYCGVSIAPPNIRRTREPGSTASPSEFAQDMLWMAPLIDQVWQPGRGYDRNVSSPYPIIFTVGPEQQQCHYYPKADIKVSIPIGTREVFKFICECNPSSTDKSSHLHAKLKLCWLSFHNLHQATYKQKEEVRQATVFPSMFHANGIMKLYLCGFCTTEQVHFFCTRHYDSGKFQEAFQLMHNLYNLRDYQYDLEDLGNDEDGLQSLLRTALGPSLNSTQKSGGAPKRTRASTGDSSGRSKRPRTGSAAESEAEIPSEHFFPENADYVEFMHTVSALCRRRGIKIDSFDVNIEIVPINRKIRTGEWRGKPIVLKFVPRRSTELSFLVLLNSDDMRSRPGNRTIELLDHFAVNDEFVCLVLPRVLTFDEARALAWLAPSEMLSLAQQAREYAAFLESVGLVHRDLKLENVGFLPGRAVVSAGDIKAQLVVLDLGRMERRNQSDLVHEYYVPRKYCPPEFFRSSEGCSPFMMDAFAAGVIATELENRANARRTKTELSVDA